MNRPNILLLTTDQQRFDTIGAMGYSYMSTPQLDKLVEEGCCFSNAYSVNPACIPARHSLLTGRFSKDHGMDDNYFDGARIMPRSLPTMASALSAAGYETIAVGKMHFQPARNHNGFGRLELMEEMPRFREDDEYASYLKNAGFGEIQSIHGVRNLLYMLPQNPLQAEECCGTPWVADRVIHHLKTNKGKRPFFYWGSWISPHAPLSIPKRFADLYREKKLPLPIPGDSNPKAITLENSRIGDYTTEEVARRGREYYYGAISWVDEQIGRIMQTLKDENLLENTLVIFTSDHGELLGDHGSFHKFQHYEGSVHIPMILRWPEKLGKGQKREEFVDLNDIFPTMLDAAGIDCLEKTSLPGASLLDTSLSGRDRTIQYIEHSHGSKRWISLRDKRYKYVYFYSEGQDELYDLLEDPEERINIADQDYCAEIRKNLRGQLLEMERRWGLPGCVKNDDFVACPPYQAKPRLPASFPIFPKNDCSGIPYFSLVKEILLAIQNEPSVCIRNLSWRDWLEAGYFTQDQMKTLLESEKLIEMENT